MLLFFGCKRAVGFSTLCIFFRQGAGSGAVFHLVVSARDFRGSYRMLQMPVAPCCPEYVRHTRELACTSSWLFHCFALFFIVLAEGVDLVGVAFSRFISVGPAVFCALVSFCPLASVAPGCVPFVCPLVGFCNLARGSLLPLVGSCLCCRFADGRTILSLQAFFSQCLQHVLESISLTLRDGIEDGFVVTWGCHASRCMFDLVPCTS